MGPVLCFVTDRRRFRNSDALVERVAAAAAAGVHLIQVRERDLQGRELLRLVRECVEAVRGTHARVIVNDRVDVALAAGAHGVHLRADSVPAPAVRRLTGRGFIVGRSVHDRAEARDMVALGGLDYVIFGTVFASASKEAGHEPAGADALATVAATVSVPVLAIGGVTADRVSTVAAAGAAGFAAIGLFADAGDTKALQTIVRQASLAFDTPTGLP